MTRALLALLFASTALAAEPVRHRVLAADRSTGKVAVVAADGTVEWEFPNKHDVHDLWLLPNGNVLTHTGHTTVVEVSLDRLRYLRATRDTIGSSDQCAVKQGLLGPQWQRPELYDTFHPRPLREAAE